MRKNYRNLTLAIDSTWLRAFWLAAEMVVLGVILRELTMLAHHPVGAHVLQWPAILAVAIFDVTMRTVWRRREA